MYVRLWFDVRALHGGGLMYVRLWFDVRREQRRVANGKTCVAPCKALVRVPYHATPYDTITMPCYTIPYDYHTIINHMIR